MCLGQVKGLIAGLRTIRSIGSDDAVPMLCRHVYLKASRSLRGSRVMVNSGVGGRIWAGAGVVSTGPFFIPSSFEAYYI